MYNSIDKYLTKHGLKETWKSLLFNLTEDQRIEHNEDISENLLENKNFYEISDLYEYSLAFIDKLKKKKIWTILYTRRCLPIYGKRNKWF